MMVRVGVHQAVDVGGKVGVKACQNRLVIRHKRTPAQGNRIARPVKQACIGCLHIAHDWAMAAVSNRKCVVVFTFHRNGFCTCAEWGIRRIGGIDSGVVAGLSVHVRRTGA